MTRLIILILTLAAAVTAATASGAEIRLRKEALASRNLVLLGDLADIFASDAEETATLKAIELMPVPASGQRRFLRIREIQDLLHARGINLASHRFSGASQVSIGARTAPDPTVRVAPMSAAQTRQAQQRAHRAISSHLGSQAANEGQQFEIEIKLNPVQARMLSEVRGNVSATGGTQPWLGSQQFELSFQTESGTSGLTVEAQIRHPDAIVVAVRPMRRGAIIRASDVTLQRGGANRLAGHQSETFQSIDEVVGMETTRAITAGQPFAAQSLRPRLMVRRGDVVTVYARSAGVEVRTFARARDDGSLGDFVSLQKLTKDRTEIRARVTGEREVDVLAQSTSVAPTANLP